MKEKKYTLPDEQEAALVREPTPAYHGNAAMVYPEDAVDEIEEYDDLDWDRMSYTGGPANEEEAIARIEAIEAENERTGNHLTDNDDFIDELKAKGLWLL